MNENHIYRRRPSCLVRYRHGGYSAVFPMTQRYHGVNILTEKIGAGSGSGSGIAPNTASGESENVLAFPGKGAAEKRPQPTRTIGRPTGRSPKSRPPKT
ncbi:MAG: hypothetical protein ACKVG6_07410 [Alphaproteobacteria bacterium]|jgi:hypothetical protein